MKFIMNLNVSDALRVDILNNSVNTMGFIVNEEEIEEV